MHLVIYGPEGSGKGTQAENLSVKLNLPIYTSGDLVREVAQNEANPFSIACKKALTEGTYVPDDVMFSLWRNKLTSEEAQKGFILDGFPRNRHQAQFLTDELTKNGYSLDHVVHLSLTNEEAVKRLALRNRKLFTGSSQSHDSPERVLKRLEQYYSQEKDMLAFFEEKKVLIHVDGNQMREKVFMDILSALGLV